MESWSGLPCDRHLYHHDRVGSMGQGEMAKGGSWWGKREGVGVNNENWQFYERLLSIQLFSSITVGSLRIKSRVKYRHSETVPQQLKVRCLAWGHYFTVVKKRMGKFYAPKLGSIQNTQYSFSKTAHTKYWVFSSSSLGCFGYISDIWYVECKSSPRSKFFFFLAVFWNEPLYSTWWPLGIPGKSNPSVDIVTGLPWDRHA